MRQTHFHLNYIFQDISFAGTRLEKQLNKGDQGINSLDAACREHDIA